MRELKSNMSELDNMTGKLREKLSLSPPRIDNEKYKSPSENRSTDEEFIQILEKARALLNSSENTAKSPDSSLTDFLPRQYDETLVETLGKCDDNSANDNSSNVSTKEDSIGTVQDEDKQEVDEIQNPEPNAYAAAYTEENSRDISWISSAHHSKSQDMLNTDVELNEELDLEEELQSNSLILLPKSLNNVSDVDFSNWDIGLNTMATLREEQLKKNEENELAEVPVESQSDTHAEEDNSQKTVSSPRTIIESDPEKKAIIEKTLIEEKEEASRKSSSSTLPSVSLSGLPDGDTENEDKVHEVELSEFSNTNELQNTETLTDIDLTQKGTESVRDKVEAAGLVWSSEEEEQEIMKEIDIFNEQLESDDSEENPKEGKVEEMQEDIDLHNESDELEGTLEVRSSISSIRKEVEDIEEKENKKERQDRSIEQKSFQDNYKQSESHNQLKEIAPCFSATMPNKLKVKTKL